MINPNELSQALYASSAMQSAKGNTNFNFGREMELDEKQR
jgi:hypothetical protein